jgi:hypothetical protein
MDVLKERLAKALQDLMIGTSFRTLQNEEVVSVEIYPVDKLNTQIRVRLPSGTRYFSVKFSEMM